MVSHDHAWHYAQSRVVSLLELLPCSSQLVLRVQMHELCVCPMLVLNDNLHPQDPQDPVFDLMCAHCHACKESAKQVRWPPCACSKGRLYGAETLQL